MGAWIVAESLEDQTAVEADRLRPDNAATLTELYEIVRDGERCPAPTRRVAAVATELGITKWVQ